MTARPILFSAPMVRALLDGRKTQTRRIVKRQFGADADPEEMSAVSTEGFQIAGHSGRWWDAGISSADDAIRCPYGVPGDTLWVKETWRPKAARQDWDLDVTYAADGETRTIKDGEFGERDWTMPKAAARGNVSPLYMPQWASRLTLAITDIRVQRLQDISEADSEAEGVREPSLGEWVSTGFVDVRRQDCHPVTAYAYLWDHINGPDCWAANPWVWAVSFDVVRS